MFRWLSKKVYGKNENEILVCSLPALFFLWPLIVMGFILWPVDAWRLANPVTFGWIWKITIILVMLAMGARTLDWKMAGIWIIVAAFFRVYGLWLRDIKHIEILERIYRFFADLNAPYPKGMGLEISILLSIPFALALIWAPLAYKWRITYNLFEHRRFGRKHTSFARTGRDVDFDYPNFFRFLFGLSGNIVISDKDGFVRVIENVLFLPIRRSVINRIIEATKVTSGDAGPPPTKQIVEVVVRGVGVQSVSTQDASEKLP